MCIRGISDFFWAVEGLMREGRGSGQRGGQDSTPPQGPWVSPWRLASYDKETASTTTYNWIRVSCLTFFCTDNNSLTTANYEKEFYPIKISPIHTTKNVNFMQIWVSTWEKDRIKCCKRVSSIQHLGVPQVAIISLNVTHTPTPRQQVLESTWSDKEMRDAPCERTLVGAICHVGLSCQTSNQLIGRRVIVCGWRRQRQDDRWEDNRREGEETIASGVISERKKKENLKRKKT